MQTHVRKVDNTHLVAAILILYNCLVRINFLEVTMEYRQVANISRTLVGN